MSSLVILMLLVQAPSAAPTPYSHYNQFTKYDRHFSKYSKRYFGAGFDWRYFKAQAIAESGLQADARSRVGAIGIIQVMPRTFEDIRQQNPQIEGGAGSTALEHCRGHLVRPAELRHLAGIATARGQTQVYVRVLQRRPRERAASPTARAR